MPIYDDTVSYQGKSNKYYLISTKAISYKYIIVIIPFILVHNTIFIEISYLHKDVQQHILISNITINIDYKLIHFITLAC